MKKPNYTPAIYTKSEIARYNDNPLTEALPNKLSPYDFFSKIDIKPDADLMNPENSDEVRKSNLLSIYSDFYTPFDQQYYLYSKFIDVLYEGYVVRSPKRFLEFLKKVERWDEDTITTSPETAFLSEIVTRGFYILGPSGSGKTTISSKLLSLIDPCIKQRNFVQVPHLRIECPEKGSSIQFCHDFFSELDHKLGNSNYREQFSRLPEHKLIKQMGNKAILHWIGMIVIDEIQNLKNISQNSAARLLNFFKKINNSVSVPIVFIGTPEATPVLHGDYQQARRSQGIGAFHWNKIAYQSKDWDRLMQSLWKLKVLKCKQELSEEIKRLYFMYSQGILDTVVTMHIAVQRWAIESGIETITPELIKKVGEDELSSTSSLIKDYLKHKINLNSGIDDHQDATESVETGESEAKRTCESSEQKIQNTTEGIEEVLQQIVEPNEQKAENILASTNETKLSSPPRRISKLLINAVADCKNSPECIYKELDKLGYIANNNKDLVL